MQKFTVEEYKLFKERHAVTGLSISEVLYHPDGIDMVATEPVDQQDAKGEEGSGLSGAVNEEEL